MPTRCRPLRTRAPVALALVVLLAACSTATPPDPAPEPPAADAPQQLRIRNAGPAAVQDLRVQFPGTEVAFGDLAPGATSDYRPVPGGVYNYAAYKARIDGREVAVPVIDWVGEAPKAGAAFTYVIAVDPAASLKVRLESVQQDR